jgi:cytochrome P450
MNDLLARDYFTDFSILKNPYAYYEAIRELGPVCWFPGRDFVVVTGYKETIEVLNNSNDFSAAISMQGPALPLPFEPRGDDVTADVEAHRAEFAGGDSLITYDDTRHSFARAILSRLFTPSRLRANEVFVLEYADQLVRGAVAKGSCELIKEIATPYVTLVIADLLGVPADERQLFMDLLDATPAVGSLNSEENLHHYDAGHPMVVMGTYFYNATLDRRKNPRKDVLTDLAMATYPDGTTPDPPEIAKLAALLFGAGQDTSAKLIGNSLRFIIDQPGLQQQLRQDPSLVAQLVEEVLRLEGSAKMTNRLARKNTRIGNLEIPAGTKVMLPVAAANRDPRRYERPAEMVLDRPKIKEHLGFGRGAHSCIGAALARFEVRIILEKLLIETSSIDMDETIHGPRGNRNLDYEPSFIIRGLTKLHLTLQPK